jgi:hypothetical protein
MFTHYQDKPSEIQVAENALAMHMSVACNEMHEIASSQGALYKASHKMLIAAIMTTYGVSKYIAGKIYDHCIDNGESVEYNAAYQVHGERAAHEVYFPRTATPTALPAPEIAPEDVPLTADDIVTAVTNAPNRAVAYTLIMNASVVMLREIADLVYACDYPENRTRAYLRNAILDATRS